MNLKPTIRRAACVLALAAAALTVSAQKVSTGIEVLKANNFKQLEGKRVGLITNPTGVDNFMKSDIDILLTVDLEQAEIAKHRNDVAKVTSRLSLEHDITVSVTVKPLEQFRRYQTALPYYRNVVREGIRYAGT